MHTVVRSARGQLCVGAAAVRCLPGPVALCAPPLQPPSSSRTTPSSSPHATPVTPRAVPQSSTPAPPSSFSMKMGEAAFACNLDDRLAPPAAVLPQRPFLAESGRCSNSEETSFPMKCHPSPSGVTSFLLPCPPCSCAALLSSLSALHFLHALLVPCPIVLADVAPAALLALAPYRIVLADAPPSLLLRRKGSHPFSLQALLEKKNTV